MTPVPASPNARVSTDAPPAPPSVNADRERPLERPIDAGECRPGTWTWVQPQPHGNSLRAAWGLRDDDVWAVGDAGTIEHWDGSTWAPVHTDCRANLMAVWGASPHDVWAVGDDTTLHFDGARWSTVPSPKEYPNYPLFDVWGTSSNDVWAGGSWDMLLHWDGRAWTKVAPGTDRGLLRFRGDGARDVSILLQDGEVMEWDGRVGTMSPPHKLPGDRRESVSMERVRNERWVFSSFGFVSIFDRDRGAWRDGPRVPVKAPTEQVVTSSWIDGRPIVLSSAGRLLTFDGKVWTVMASMTPPRSRADGPIALFGSWAFGRLGEIWKREGATWKAVRLARDRVDRTGVWASSSNDVWITRADGDVDRFDGKQWSRSSTGLAHANAVVSFDANDTWVAGDGGLAHWTGSAFTRHVLDEALTSIAAKSRDDIWAVSKDAAFHWDGRSWSRVVLPSDTSFHDVAIDGAGDVWLRGRESSYSSAQVYEASNRWKIFRWTNSSFVEKKNAGPWHGISTDRVRALARVAPDDVVVLTAGFTRNVFHRRTGERRTEEVPPLESLVYKQHAAVHALPSGEAWIVASDGIVVRRCASLRATPSGR